jgi:Formamidopyrimidine-DNA glycosylase N-terminal domain
MYRRAAATVVGRTIAKVDAPDAWFCKGTTPLEVKAALAGLEVAAVRRRGKLMMLDVIDGPTLGIRFGMTGRLVVDGVSPISALEYGAKRSDPIWDRFGLRFNDGTGFVISDPRRLGGVELDPDEDALGPDAYTGHQGSARQAALGYRGGGQSSAARPAASGRYRQSSGRRDSLALRSRSGSVCFVAEPKGHRCAPPIVAAGTTRVDRAGRVAYRGSAEPTESARRLPERRREFATSYGWWSHHVFLSKTSGLMPSVGSLRVKESSG